MNHHPIPHHVFVIFLIFFANVSYFIWSRDAYSEYIESIQGTPMHMNPYWGLVVVLFLYFWIAFRILPHRNCGSDGTRHVLEIAAIDAFIVYGGWGAINMTMFHPSKSLIVSDTIWGIIMTVGVVYVSILAWDICA